MARLPLEKLQAMQRRAIFDERMARLMLAVGAKTDKDLADYLGITQPSVAGARKRGQLPPAWIMTVSERSGVSADWILYDKGRMQLSGRNHRISEPRTSITPDPTRRGGDLVVTVLESCDDLDQSHVATLDNEKFALIPMTDSHLSGDDGEFVSRGRRIEFAFRRDWLERIASAVNNVILMPVHGESMEPSLVDGDVVIVDLAHKRIEDGSIYAIGAGDVVLLRRLYLLSVGRYRIVSDNPMWDPEEVDPSQIRILGKVIWRAGPPGLGRRR